jgi:hypothetical protein
MRNPIRNPAVWLAAAMLCGCGSSEPTGKSSTAPGPVRRTVRASDGLSPHMVSAVAAHKPAAVPVQVKFELHGRPAPAQPLAVAVALVPLSSGVDRITGKVIADEGLDLVEGAELAPADRPAEGVPLTHTVKLLPRREGIFIVSAVVTTVDSAGQTTSETFSMPVIAGAGFTEPSAKPAGKRPPATAAAQ